MSPAHSWNNFDPGADLKKKNQLDEATCLVIPGIKVSDEFFFKTFNTFQFCCNVNHSSDKNQMF